MKYFIKTMLLSWLFFFNIFFAGSTAYMLTEKMVNWSVYHHALHCAEFMDERIVRRTYLPCRPGFTCYQEAAK